MAKMKSMRASSDPMLASDGRVMRRVDIIWRNDLRELARRTTRAIRSMRARVPSAPMERVDARDTMTPTSEATTTMKSNLFQAERRQYVGKP